MFVVVHDLTKFLKVLLHLVLNDLTVSLLDSLKVLLGLLQLVFAVINEGSGAKNFLPDLVHDAGDNLNLIGAQISLKNALGTEQFMRILRHHRFLDLLVLVRMNFVVDMLWTFDARRNNRRRRVDFGILFLIQFTALDLG